MRVSPVFLLIFSWNYGFSQELTPIEEATPSYFPLTEDEVMIGEDIPSAKPDQTFDLMQNLRDEVRDLRGIVEQMSFQLREVKQRQLDDYLDLDKRLGVLERSRISDQDADFEKNREENPNLSESDDLASFPNSEIVNEKLQSEIRSDYERASQKLLRDRDIVGATQALLEHLDRYPQSTYAPNVRYWLGEIYLLQDKVESARQQFSIILDQYSNHAKAKDSKFKLGKIYYDLGQFDMSEKLMESVSDGQGPISEKASKFLNENF